MHLSVIIVVVPLSVCPNVDFRIDFFFFQPFRLFFFFFQDSTSFIIYNFPISVEAVDNSLRVKYKVEQNPQKSQRTETEKAEKKKRAKSVAGQYDKLKKLNKMEEMKHGDWK